MTLKQNHIILWGITLVSVLVFGMLLFTYYQQFSTKHKDNQAKHKKPKTHIVFTSNH